MIHIFHTHVHIYMLTHLKFETHTMNISGGRITSTYALPPPRFPGIISQKISKVSSTVLPYSQSSSEPLFEIFYIIFFHRREF